MVDFPSGTVTFLFTDIEGSTRLLQQLGDRYAVLLAEHQELLRAAFEEHNGSIIDTQGDSFFVAFHRTADAIQAAVESQRALAAHTWPEEAQVRVRMGLHTGEPQFSGSNYVGIDVHRAARISAAAHGGQVLLSQTTFDLIENDLPAGVAVRDLGAHRLKDLRSPKHLYQLLIAGLPSEFPELQSLDRSPNNLPVQLTSFIGRAQEIGDVKQLLSTHRLVTLTGPGGSGKTRLALQVAAETIDSYPDGVFFVPLAPLTDPGLVASTISQTFGIAESAGRSIVEGLKEFLRTKSLLLLLDNFEQLIQGAPTVADLLGACRELKILVTSREGLRISGEREYPVPPLDVPDPAKMPAGQSLSQYAAVELFIQRAQAIKPDFLLTAETAAPVAQICARLDGLPLAIELAAARIKLLPPRAMLARLEHRLEFLTGGARDLPARQQTLRNAIAWSYDLLDEIEQQVFRQMSVFVGGCSLEAIEAVVGEAPAQTLLLDNLGSLLDKSLLREIEDPNGEPRFLMLETLREFGLEQLIAKGEVETVRYRHADYYLTLARKDEPRVEGKEQVDWIHRMERDHDNLRVALEWSRTAHNGGEICMQLADMLGLFWEARGYYSEGRERLSAILALEIAQGRTAARARLLARAAELAYRQSDYPATILFAGESLEICREVGDQQGIASALIKLGNAFQEGGDYSTAPRYLEEALALWRNLKDRRGTARALISLGWAALRSGDYPLANARLEEALSISRELGDTRSIGFELSGLGEVSLRQGDYQRAMRLLEESLELRRQAGNKWGIGVSLGTLGWVAIREGDWKRAISRLTESLEVRQEIGDKGGCAWCLERLAEIALAQGRYEKSTRLYAAAAALRASLGSVIDPADQPEMESKLASLRVELGDDRFAAVWEEGGTMTLDQAVADALAS